MKNLMIAGLIGAGLVGAYLAFSKLSVSERLHARLTETLPKDAQLTLEGCAVSVVSETRGSVVSETRGSVVSETRGSVVSETRGTGPVAVTRSVLRTDLRHYRLKTVGITPQGAKAVLRISRKPATAQMLDQAAAVLKAGGTRAAGLLEGGDETLRNYFDREGGKLSFQVMAEIVTTEGKTDLVAHKDAPAFYDFVQAVEALPAPVSFQSVASFAQETMTAQTLLTGSVVVLPELKFAVPDQEAAKDLAKLIYEYSAKQRCS